MAEFQIAPAILHITPEDLHVALAIRGMRALRDEPMPSVAIHFDHEILQPNRWFVEYEHGVVWGNKDVY